MRIPEHSASFYLLSGLHLQLSPTGQVLSRTLQFIINIIRSPQELIFWGSLFIRTSNPNIRVLTFVFHGFCFAGKHGLIAGHKDFQARQTQVLQFV